MRFVANTFNVAILGALLLTACGREEAKLPNVQPNAQSKIECNQAEEKDRAECLHKNSSASLSGTATPESQQITALPDVLRSFLQKNPTFRLLAAADVRAHPEFACLAGPKPDATCVAFLQNHLANDFHPFKLADTNGDGLKDIVAVLIEGGKFNVIVFKGKAQGFNEEPVWILRDEKESLVGVLVGERGGIVPLYCLGCSNSVFVWTGDGYELDASAVGDHVCFMEKARLYSEPSYASKIVHETPPKSVAIVVEIGPREPKSEATLTQSKHRWYKVKLEESKEKQGFARDDTFDTEPGMCD